MTNSFYHRIIYVPIVVFLLGWALFATLARGSPAQPEMTSGSFVQPEESRAVLLPLAELPIVLDDVEAEPLVVQEEAEIAVPEADAWDFQAEASELLDEVQGLSVKLRRDAETLKSFARNHNVSWRSHATQLNLMRDHVNAIGDRLARLQDIRHVTAAWQQEAIDLIHPVAADVANRTEAAILHLNEYQGYLFAPDYQEHVTAVADQASELENHVGDFLEYAAAQQQLEQLRGTLEAIES